MKEYEDFDFLEGDTPLLRTESIFKNRECIKN